MRIAFHYSACYPAYLGGMLRAAAKRLGLDFYSQGPNAGRWISDAPEDVGWRHDIETPAGPVEARIDADVLVNVDAGCGAYAIPTNRIPIVHCFTESNEGEHARARASGASVVWSCMPFKPEGLQTPGLRYLEWGYDESHIDEGLHEGRVWDFHQRGSAHEARLPIWAEAIRRYGARALVGVPVSRWQWGAELMSAKITLCDGPGGPFIAGRVVDAMAAGCLVICRQSPQMAHLAPRGYAVFEDKGEGVPPPEAVFPVVDAYLRDDARRQEMCARALTCVRGLSWSNQLLRILGSVGVYP